MFLHDNALEHEGVPEPGRDPVRGRRHHRRPAPRRRRRRLHDLRRHREHPLRGEGGPRARPGRARHHRAGDGAAGQRARRVPQGRPLLRRRRCTRCRCATTGGPTSTPWPRCVNENTVLVVGSAPQYPQGVIDPIPELAALAADVGRQLPHRRVHGRLRPARSWSSSATTCRRGTSASTASPRSRPTSTSSATRRRARRCCSTAPRSCAATRPSCSTTGSAASTPRRACRARGPACRWRPRGPSCTTSASRATGG